MYRDANPSLKSAKTSFYWGKLDRDGNNSVDPEDICYDSSGDGILDGTSQAQLINLDSLANFRHWIKTVLSVLSMRGTICLIALHP